MVFLWFSNAQGLAAILAASGGSPLPGPQRRFLRQQLAAPWSPPWDIDGGSTVVKHRETTDFTWVLPGLNHETMGFMLVEPGNNGKQWVLC